MYRAKSTYKAYAKALHVTIQTLANFLYRKYICIKLCILKKIARKYKGQENSQIPISRPIPDLLRGLGPVEASPLVYYLSNGAYSVLGE
jgi:hypothetical protein